MLQCLAILLLGLGLPVFMGLSNLASWSWIGLGAAAWIVAVLLKVCPGGLLRLLLEHCLQGQRMKAALWGVWSALMELGVAAIAFSGAGTFPGLGDAAGFGVGAGSVEALNTLRLALGIRIAARIRSPSKLDVKFLDWIVVVERYLTSGGHLATRGLVWAGLQSLFLVPGMVLAVATFSLVDGIASYGHAVKWNWADPRIARRFLGFLSVITIVEAVAFMTCVFLLSGSHPVTPSEPFGSYEAAFRYIAEREGLPADAHTAFMLAADSTLERSHCPLTGDLVVVRAEYFGQSRFGIRGAQGQGRYYAFQTREDGWRLVGIFDGNSYRWDAVGDTLRVITRWHMSAARSAETVYTWNGESFQ
jgi:hypothetical protein